MVSRIAVFSVDLVTIHCQEIRLSTCVFCTKALFLRSFSREADRIKGREGKKRIVLWIKFV